MKRGVRAVLGLGLMVGLGIPGALIGLFWWAGSGGAMSDGRSPILENPQGAAAPLARPETLRVLSWNIHYGVGPKDDMGNLRTRDEVLHWLEEIAAVLQGYHPDVVLLQESDFASHRTHDIDQMRFLAEKLGFRYMAPVVTWDKNHVPHPVWPISQQYGRMKSGQCVISRFPIVENERFALTQPAENPWWYNRFYLNRMLQHTVVDVAGTRVSVFNVHNEAFHQNNREGHAALVADLVTRSAQTYTVVAGDFNAIPPEATLRKGFPDEPETDMTTDRSIEILRRAWPTWGEVYPEAATRRDEGKSLSFPAEKANRRLDYLWYSPAWVLAEGGVYRQAGARSDHLPTYAVLRFEAPSVPPIPENDADSP